MQTPTPPPSTLVSPSSKRKRATTDTLLDSSPSPTRIKTTNLPSRTLVDDTTVAGGSPRTNVAGHLQSLDLDEQTHIPNLDFNAIRASDTANYGFTNDPSFEPRLSLPLQNPQTADLITPPSSSHGQPFLHSISGHLNEIPTQSSLPLDQPSTPVLRPVTTTAAPKSPPLLPSISTSPTDPSTATSTNSPPPYALWWSETEITGHNPTDPADDGYGINGVGFIPTPAMATARAEKRRRQVREWKEREAREARSRRGERRRRARDDVLGGRRGSAGKNVVEGCAIGAEEGRVEREGRRVRFLEV